MKVFIENLRVPTKTGFKKFEKGRTAESYGLTEEEIKDLAPYLRERAEVEEKPPERKPGRKIKGG